MNTNSRKRRRQRAVLSCNDCRRRKLKCDRLAPCDRCIKGGTADTCAYGSESHDTAPEDVHNIPKRKYRKNQKSTVVDSAEALESETGLGPDDDGQLDAAPENRLEKLERDIALLQQRVPSSVHEPKDQVEFLGSSPDLKGISRSSAVMGMLKGHGYGTHFYGASSAMSIIAQFPDLRLFMNVAYSDSTARRLSQDMKASEDRARSLRPHHRVLSVDSLRSLLPDRPTVDAILTLYFDTFETTFRIIHVPTFDAAYRNYWESQSLEDTDMDALILAILACTICTSTHAAPRYNHSGSTFHSKTVLWVKACEAWLKQQSNKRRSLVTLQVRCLRLLALATSSMKVKEYYQEVQAHVALLRSAGMHRDPNIFGTRCSIFEGEMRRRLWATTMELELQASIDKGTSSVLSGLDHDCASPRNINDSELSIDLTELPRSHGITTYTDTAYLHVTSVSLKLRIRLSCNINKIRYDASLHDTFEDEEALGQHLLKIPRWTDPRSIQAMTLLELQLRQFLVVLHTPRALRSNSQTKPYCRYSMITALEAATATIQLHVSLLKHANYALVLTRNDYFRAILLISHVAYHAQRDNDMTMMRFAKQIFDETHENALRLQQERAMRPGRGTEYFWYVSAAVSLVGIQFKTAKAELLKRQAVDRIQKLLYCVLALQDEPTKETLATEVLLVDRPVPVTGVGNRLQNSPDYLSGESFGDAGLQLNSLGLGDASELMMDDLWFLDVPALDNISPLDYDI